MKLFNLIHLYLLLPMSLLISISFLLPAYIYFKISATEYAPNELSFLENKQTISKIAQTLAKREINLMLHLLNSANNVFSQGNTLKEDKQVDISIYDMLNAPEASCLGQLARGKTLSPYDYISHDRKEKDANLANFLKKFSMLVPYLQSYFKLDSLVRNPNSFNMYVVSERNRVVVNYPITTKIESLEVYRSFSNPLGCVDENGDTITIYDFKCRDWYIQATSTTEQGLSLQVSNIYFFSSGNPSFTICMNMPEDSVNRLLFCIDKIPRSNYHYFEMLIGNTEGYFSLIRPNSANSTLKPEVIPTFYPFFQEKQHIYNLIRYEFPMEKSFSPMELAEFEKISAIFTTEKELTDSELVLTGSYKRRDETWKYEVTPLFFKIHGKNEEKHLVSLVSTKIIDENQELDGKLVEKDILDVFKVFYMGFTAVYLYIILRNFAKQAVQSIIFPIRKAENLLNKNENLDLNSEEEKTSELTVIKSEEIIQITNLLVDLHKLNQKQRTGHEFDVNLSIFARNTYQKLSNTKGVTVAEALTARNLQDSNNLSLSMFHLQASLDTLRGDKEVSSNCPEMERTAGELVKVNLRFLRESMGTDFNFIDSKLHTVKACKSQIEQVTD